MIPLRRLAAPLATSFCIGSYLFLPLVPQATAVSVYPIAEIRPGLAVEARTVFAGTEVESFPLEVIGVLERGRAGGDLIIARATDERVRQTGIVAGMSGSPVYAADGRVLGALAFSWSFTKEPICGITPIDEMLELWELETIDPEWDLTPDREPSGERAAGMPRLQTPLAVSGLSDEALTALSPWAEEHDLLIAPGGASAMQSGGGGTRDDGAATPLEPGAAVSVELLRGDASISAIGTVTAVENGRALLFGHPFLYTGPTRLPLTEASIVGIVARTQTSFKLGTPGRAIGTATQDRRVGVAARLGEAPAMMPVSVRVRNLGGEWESYAFEVAAHRNLAPILTTVATAGALTSRGGIPPESTWRWRERVDYREEGGAAGVLVREDLLPIRLANPFFESSGRLVQALMDNPWTPVHVDSVAIEIEVLPAERSATVVAARIDRAEARAGETVLVEIDLEELRGERETVRIPYRIPDKVSEGTVLLYAGGGIELSRLEAQRAPGRARAASLDDWLRRVDELPKNTTLYVTAYETNPEFTVRGKDYPDLPGSAQRILGEETQREASAAWGRLTRLTEVEQTREQAIQGGTLLRVQITDTAPRSTR